MQAAKRLCDRRRTWERPPADRLKIVRQPLRLAQRHARQCFFRRGKNERGPEQGARVHHRINPAMPFRRPGDVHIAAADFVNFVAGPPVNRAMFDIAELPRVIVGVIFQVATGMAKMVPADHRNLTK